MKRLIRSMAPLRLGLGGGSSDLAPFVRRYGGEVLNATINKCVHATLVPNDSDQILLRSEDYGITREYDSSKALPYDDELDLVCAVINRVRGTKEYNVPKSGFDIYLRSDAPPGAGLGTSSTVVVAILGLFNEWCNIHMGNYQLAHLAWEIERVDMKMAGGKQDQYSAVFGGFNLMYFRQNDEVLIVPLKVPRSTLLELQNNLLLVYSGKTHKSGEIIMSQTPNSLEKFNWILHIKNIAQAMVEDLLAKDLENFGELLSMEWLYKKRLSSKTSNEYLEKLANAAMEAGSIGLKITGAGGGGMFLIYCPWRKRTHIANTMKKQGCKVIDYSFRVKGLQTWSVKYG